MDGIGVQRGKGLTHPGAAETSDALAYEAVGIGGVAPPPQSCASCHGSQTTNSCSVRNACPNDGVQPAPPLPQDCLGNTAPQGGRQAVLLGNAAEAAPQGHRPMLQAPRPARFEALEANEALPPTKSAALECESPLRFRRFLEELLTGSAVPRLKDSPSSTGCDTGSDS